MRWMSVAGITRVASVWGVGWHLPLTLVIPKFGSFYVGVGIKGRLLGKQALRKLEWWWRALAKFQHYEGLMKRQGVSLKPRENVYKLWPLFSGI